MHYSKFIVAGVAGLLVAVSTAKLLAAQAFFTCTPSTVAATNDPSPNQRVTVVCTSAVVDGTDSIIYFAVPAADTAYANRFLTLATTALTAGRTLSIGYDFGKSTDLNNVAFGCASSNCRYARQINLQ